MTVFRMVAFWHVKLDDWLLANLSVPRLIIDCIAGAIIRLVASVCVSVRLSVSALLFEPLTFDLDFPHEGRP